MLDQPPENPYTLAAMFNGFHRICLSAFLIDGLLIIGLLALPFYVLDHVEGGNVTICGVIVALQMAAYACTCVVASGYVSRAKHGLNWALLGIVIHVTAMCTVPLCRSPWACAAVVMVSAVGMAFVWPALHSWVGAGPDPRVRKRHMVWFNLAWSSGFAVGPLLAGPLYDYDYRAPFVLLGALGVLSVLLVRSVPHEIDYFGSASTAQLEARARHDRASEIFLYTSWCATFLATAFGAVTRSVFPDRMQELVGNGSLRLLFEENAAQFLTVDPATKLSWPSSALGIATAVTFVLLATTNRWRHRFGPLLGMQAVVAAALYVLGQTTSLVVMTACFAVIGANHALAFFSSAYYSLAIPEQKHRRASMNEAAVGFGGFTGAIVFGYIAGKYAFSIPFQAGPLIVLAFVVLQFALLQFGKRQARRRSTTLPLPPA